MPRIFANIALFALGLTMAGLVVYFTEIYPRERSISELRERVTVRERKDLMVNLSAKPPIDREAVKKREEAEAKLRLSLAQGEGYDTLREALEAGGLESFQVIRSDFISTVPNYPTVLLPLLKRWVMDGLLARFEESDWKNWPRSSTSKDGQPTDARIYVNNISLVNRDLGSSLETAALLFHGLFLATTAGEPYDIKEGLKYTLANAEELLNKSSDAIIPARDLLSAMVIIDPTFSSAFERERCRLVGSTLSSHAGVDVARDLQLIATLDAEFCSPDVFWDVAELIHTVSTEGSARLRQEILDSELEGRSLNGFARRDDRVREALAELYSVTSVDLLEAGSADLARRYLSESIGLKPGLHSQEYAEKIFRGLPSKSIRPTDAREKTKKVDLEVEGIESSSGSYLVSIFSILVLLVGAAVATLVGLRVLSSVRNRTKAEIPSVTEGDNWNPLQPEAIPGIDESRGKPEIRLIKDSSKVANQK